MRSGDMTTFHGRLLASERSERDTLRSVQSRIAIYVYIIVRMSHLPFDP